jgi:hypothetical protein|uniref:Uncharacterized protein n=1 Tax=viral metagenome TaxID=1070528 RepID=A0A6C0BH47_9ZZZZ
MQLELKKFDISRVQDDNVVVLLGKRKTGKSFLIRDIMYYHRDIPVGSVISGSESSNNFYGSMVPKLFIHEDYKPEIIDNILKRQSAIMKRYNKEKKQYGKTSIDPRAFLIMDDCLHDNCWKRDKNIRYIFMNGRHRKLMFLLPMQYPLGVPPDLRTNVDFAFILRENNFNNRKRIYENYASIFPTFDVFCSVMDVITEGYGCLVIDNTSMSNKLEECVYWYEAEDHEQYTLGSKIFWQMHNENVKNDEEEEEEEDVFDMTKFKKRSAIPLTVKKGYR